MSWCGEFTYLRIRGKSSFKLKMKNPNESKVTHAPYQETVEAVGRLRRSSTNSYTLLRSTTSINHFNYCTFLFSLSPLSHSSLSSGSEVEKNVGTPAKRLANSKKQLLDTRATPRFLRQAPHASRLSSPQCLSTAGFSIVGAGSSVFCSEDWKTPFGSVLNLRKPPGTR
eukprot:GHVN01025525.1.p1 GENE.GHVN01025525.1~~GHVN01025525.1.p1  ORF type:complete len:169 (+),score=17.26 GHVN01025525.1:44-550(+)